MPKTTATKKLNQKHPKTKKPHLQMYMQTFDLVQGQSAAHFNVIDTNKFHIAVL